MDRFDLMSVGDRLAVAAMVFGYPTEPHRRRHGPTGYKDYESYREWLRDEFSYRCVYSLVREQWIARPGNFDIDHMEPRADRPDLTCEYDNLLYLTHQVNLVRNRRPLPDPCKFALGECLRVHSDGDRVGEVEALNELGERIIRILRLDSEDATGFRRRMFAILRSLAINDVRMFRQLVGFPSDLPDLRAAKRRNRDNTRPEGIRQSALQLRENGTLPNWY